MSAAELRAANLAPHRSATAADSAADPAESQTEVSTLSAVRHRAVRGQRA